MSLITLARYGPPTGHQLAATFAFDPAMISIIRDVPGRKWDPKRKIWTIPDNPEAVHALKNRLERAGHTIRITPDVRDYLNAEWNAARQAQAIRDAGDHHDIEWPLATQPYAHQRAGLGFLNALGGGALLWEMGLGKTLAAIAYAENLARSLAAFQRVLVICPNTVRRSVWAQQIEEHAGHRDYVVPDGPYTRRLPLVASRRYTILNTEALSHPAMQKRLMEFEWDLVIVDESTRFKGPRAARTKALLKIRAKRRIAMTGTPLTNTPEDLWSQLEFVAPGIFGSWFGFRDRYLMIDHWGSVEGVNPHTASELRQKLDSRSYRILKEQVLDLPPKVYSDRIVTLTDEQRKQYNLMRDELRAAYSEGEIEAYNVLTQLLRLTQITSGFVGERGRYDWIEGNAKERELAALLDEIGDEPAVVFGLYQKELEELYRRFHDIPFDADDTPAIIYGPTRESDRERLIREFQAGQRKRLFIQSRTGGLGITLTAARTAIYYTRGWSLEDYLQSQDRLHRIGQTGTVTIVHLIAEKTVDEEIAKTLRSKQATADDLTGDDARRLVRTVLGMKDDA